MPRAYRSSWWQTRSSLIFHEVPVLEISGHIVFAPRCNRSCLVLLPACLMLTAGACGPPVASCYEFSAECDFLTPNADLSCPWVPLAHLYSLIKEWKIFCLPPFHTKATGSRVQTQVHLTRHLNHCRITFWMLNMEWNWRTSPEVPDSTSTYLGFLMSCPSYPSESGPTNENPDIFFLRDLSTSVYPSDHTHILGFSNWKNTSSLSRWQLPPLSPSLFCLWIIVKLFVQATCLVLNILEGLEIRASFIFPMKLSRLLFSSSFKAALESLFTFALLLQQPWCSLRQMGASDQKGNSHIEENRKKIILMFFKIYISHTIF